MYFQITTTDGLPQKICTICISYLQHAVNFREQVLNNNNRIRTSNIIKPKQLKLTNTSATSERSYPMNETNVSKAQYERLKSELDLFFQENNDLDTDDDSDVVSHVNENEYDSSKFTKTETTKTAIHNFFNYSEKIFEEDDISDFYCIEMNEPDDLQERKCHACKCRFMLHDRYESHMKECIQAKLVTFITDCHQLLIVKKYKAVSTSEFVRRMIFALKSIVKSLALSFRLIIEKHASKDSSEDEIECEEIFIKLDQKWFEAPEGIFGTLPQLKPICPPLPVVLGLGDKNSKMTSSTPNKSKIPYAAKCSMCKVHFKVVDELEKHNRQTHNTSQGQDSSTTSKRSFNNGNQSFMIDDDNYSHDGIVDVLELHRRSPKVVNIELNPNN